jgi:hypothetical protein
MTVLTAAASHGYSLILKPQSPSDQERRILAALGLARGPLPRVTLTWLTRYHAYLAAKLRLPFAARCPEDTDIVRVWTAAVTVVELIPPTEDAISRWGLLCKALRGTERAEIPLVELEVENDPTSAELIEDYWYWFWNWRFDPQI